jgi:hypothetical protein
MHVFLQNRAICANLLKVLNCKKIFVKIHTPPVILVAQELLPIRGTSVLSLS